MVDYLKTFNRRIWERLREATDDGNVSLRNEITANLMVATVMVIMTVATILCWLLNEIGVFTADIFAMRWALVISLLLEVPTQIIHSVLGGARSWIKHLLLFCVLAQCAVLVAVLGHNVALVMIIPMVLSLRYYNKRLTSIIALSGVVLFVAATVYCSFFGVVNLNVLVIDPGVQITVVDTLRNALLSSGYDQHTYMKSLLSNDLLPRLLIYTVVAVICVRIASRGKEVVEFQNKITAKTSRVETELDLATRIQAGMLPCIFPAFPNHSHLELFAFNTPAKEVGGDFYDYFAIDEDRVAIVIADVSGKGVGAALFMTISKILVKNQMQLGLGPAYALIEANSQLCENNEACLFVTVWAAEYNLKTNMLTFANAGHNPPVLIRKGQKSEYLSMHPGFVLAGLEDYRYSESSISLYPGDEIILYTDGVTEANDLDHELFGEQRLLDALDAAADLPVDEQLNFVKKKIDVFAKGVEQADDITMLGMRIVD